MTVPTENDPTLETLEEESRSAIARFEYGWLVGLAAGLAVLFLIGRRRRRRRRTRDSPDNLYR